MAKVNIIIVVKKIFFNYKYRTLIKVNDNTPIIS